jgi:hypothetical protein
MGVIRGTNVGAPIVPGAEEDEFPTHIDKYGAGGYRAVAYAADLNTIPVARRRPGMVVLVLENKTYWVLAPDGTTWIEDTLDGGNF